MVNEKDVSFGSAMSGRKMKKKKKNTKKSHTTP